MISSFSLSSRVDDFVERYETAWSRDGDADLIAFLPERDDPDYLAVAAELLRVDLERRWQAGQPRSADDYRRSLAGLLGGGELWHDLAYEEYRHRIQSGETVQPDEFARRYEIDTRAWPTTARVPLTQGVATIHELEPQLQRLTDAIQPFPEVGGEFAGFRLLRQIGEGAFGRVYLASQQDLAARHVVLKITAGVTLEPQRLASLQHTHIVPIHSVHEVDGLHVICMPYVGVCTFADVIRARNESGPVPASGEFVARLLTTIASGREESSEFGARQIARFTQIDVEMTCIELIEPIAAALAYAHDRGIAHRDLKPANLLLSDDGQPMLLDFNISDEVVAGGRACLFVGGTLPYMAPEQIRALATGTGIDQRSDIYSLGVILHELLTGQRPAVVHEVARAKYQDAFLSGLLADESSTAIDAQPASTVVSSSRLRDIRATNPQVSADMVAIIDRCLRPRPDDRYQSMREVCEDLHRHRRNLPIRYGGHTPWRERLRKCSRRHPALWSHISLFVMIGTLTLMLMAGLIGRARVVAKLNGERALSDIERQLPGLRVMFSSPYADPDALAQARAEAIQLLEVLQAGQGELKVERAYRGLSTDQQRRLREAAGELFDLLADDDAVGRSNALTRGPLARAMDGQLQAMQLLREGRARDAIPLFERLREQNPHDFSTWLLLGDAYASVGDSSAARACYDAAVALWPQVALTHFHRGMLWMSQRQFEDAAVDFQRAKELDSHNTSAVLNHAIALLELKDFDAAERCFTEALAAGVTQTRVFELRARAREQLGDVQGARQDREELLRREPTDAESCVVRGNALLSTNVEQALASFQRALQWDPRCRAALRNIAYVYAERLADHERALEIMQRLIESFDAQPADVVSRGVLLARRGDRDAAVADGQRALSLSRDSKIVFQVGCIYALGAETHPVDAAVAIQLIGEAISRDPRWLSVARRDSDLAALRDEPRFRQLIQAASALAPYAATGEGNP